MKAYVKKAFPVSQVRMFLEPGPLILVSSQWKKASTIMTMGWHMILEFEPSLVGCYIWKRNLSFDYIRKSKECVINVPAVDLAKRVVQIGNCSGRDINKFETFKLTPLASEKVNAPLIKECFANFECKLIDSSLIHKYSLFIFEVVNAHVAEAPTFPTTLHYRGEGLLMISGKTTAKYRKLFKPEML